ncbi:MAG: hypothetical protein RLZZ66_192 [Pseudomonadota bacterium]|jgi:DNA-binding protein H-NS
MNIKVKDITAEDLINNTQEELKEFINTINKSISLRKDIDKKELINQIQLLAEKGGFKIEDLLVKQTKSVEARYLNPENQNETWTGRGKYPKWLQAFLDRGRNLDEFLIEKK